jgi:ribosomal protein L7/L12
VIAPVIASGAPPSADLRYYIGVRHQIAWTDAGRASAELLRSFPVEQTLGREQREAQIDREFKEGLTRDITVGQPLQLRKTQPDAAEEPVDLFMISHGANKISVIKVIREFTGLGLAETKLLVESFPPVRVAHAMPRSRAAAFARELKAVGANMLDPSKTIK